MPKPEQAQLAGLPSSYAKPDGGSNAGRALCIHGLFGNHHQFDSWLEFLASSNFEAHAVSLRGRLGTPPERAAGVALADYVTDVKRALDELGPDTFLIGTSLGGLVGLKAIGEGGQARAAVLLAPIHDRPLVPRPAMLPAIPQLVPKALAGLPLKLPDSIVDDLILNCVPVDERGPFRRGLGFDSGRAIRSVMLGAGARRVGCPVLVVAGAEDRIVSPGSLRAMARRHKADFRVLENHGHWLPFESGWETLAEDVVNWLQKVRPVTRPATF
jgi:pimeloyl-ACP methyl ester carboxylesterase